jgi:hypothetical protein
MVAGDLTTSPNPRLHRTRLRSPLSRKPFGVWNSTCGVEQ